MTFCIVKLKKKRFFVKELDKQKVEINRLKSSTRNGFSLKAQFPLDSDHLAESMELGFFSGIFHLAYLLIIDYFISRSLQSEKGYNIPLYKIYGSSLGPLIEEIAFRHYLHNSIKFLCRKVTQNNTYDDSREERIASIITSNIFAVSHYDPGRSMKENFVKMFQSASFGKIAADIKHERQDLWAPITMHIIKNTIALGLL